MEKKVGDLKKRKKAKLTQKCKIVLGTFEEEWN